MERCPNCGAGIEEGARSCWNCGVRLVQEGGGAQGLKEQASQKQETTRGQQQYPQPLRGRIPIKPFYKEAPFIILIVALIIGAVLGTSFFVFFGDDTDSEETPEEAYAEIKLTVVNPHELDYEINIGIYDKRNEDLYEVEWIEEDEHISANSEKYYYPTIDITHQEDYVVGISMVDNPDYLVSTRYVNLDDGHNEIEIRVL